jgi:hypothetical protein
MLERQRYPDLRLFPGGPPEPPYDVTGHTLWMLLGVDVQQVDAPFEASLELVTDLHPAATPVPSRPKGAYLVGPESYGVFKMVAELQKANVPTFRAAKPFEAGGRSFLAGTFVIPPTAAAASSSVMRRLPRQPISRRGPNTRARGWAAAGRSATSSTTS